MKRGKSKTDTPKKANTKEEFWKTFKEKNPNNKSIATVTKAGGDKWKSLTEEIIVDREKDLLHEKEVAIKQLKYKCEDVGDKPGMVVIVFISGNDLQNEYTNYAYKTLQMVDDTMKDFNKENAAKKHLLNMFGAISAPAAFAKFPPMSGKVAAAHTANPIHEGLYQKIVVSTHLKFTKGKKTTRGHTEAIRLSCIATDISIETKFICTSIAMGWYTLSNL
ncbi:hypothetical protein ZIOFF_047362 [Zingiber officinale]|uniref:HMG box domain-containing protein n=1 Tax=Zingiber officinale TaxID=94328 RepID=A0A8J5FRD2_ZINOF|nr:hypothetical protein ZIOFF_047362 [Zingiber officinale]